MKIQFCGKSDVGKKREKNEDNFLINKKLGFCVVADGMGGHQGGARASEVAVNTIDEVMSSLLDDPEATIQEGFDVTPGNYETYLRYAINVANQHIFDESSLHGSLKGMGTTVVTFLFRDDNLYIAHVGDSRAYLIKNNEIIQITKDHSLVEEQVEAGIISPNDAKEHRFKNIITRSVGFEDKVEPDVSLRKPITKECYLICSDGLSNMLDDEEIKDIVTNNKIKTACSRLIELANERGGDDNITVVLAYVEEGMEQPEEELTEFNG